MRPGFYGVVFPPELNFVSFAGRVCGIGALAIILAGCQGITGSAGSPQVRIIDASPDAGGLDVYQGSSILAYNLEPGTITSYIPTSPGNYTIHVDRAGTRTHLLQHPGTFTGDSHWSLLIGNPLAEMQGILLRDQTQPAPAGQVSLRILDQSAQAGPVDVYLIPSGSVLSRVRPLLNGLAFNRNTGYLNMPVGMYTLAVLPAGTIPTASTTTLYSGPVVSYASGSARTVVLIDRPQDTGATMQVIVADDYDPASAF